MLEWSTGTTGDDIEGEVTGQEGGVFTMDDAAGGVLVEIDDKDVMAGNGDPGDGVACDDGESEGLGDKECTGEDLEDNGDEASSVTVAG